MAQTKTQQRKVGKNRGGNGRSGRTGVLRRPPQEGLPRLRHALRQSWLSLLEACPVWLVFFVLVGTWCLLPRSAFFAPRVEAGSVASRTYIATRDLAVPNEEATRLLQQQARERVPAVYDLSKGLTLERRRQLATLFEAGRAALAPAETPIGASVGGGGQRAGSSASNSSDEAAFATDDLLDWLQAASPFKVDREQVVLLEERSFSRELEDRIGGILSRVLRQGVVRDKDVLLEQLQRGVTLQELPSGDRRLELDLYRYLAYPEQVRQTVEQDLLNWDGLTSRERQAFSDLIVANVSPNLTYNSSSTLALRQQAEDAEGTAVHTIRKGEAIVRKGAEVDVLAAKAIEAQAGSRDLSRLVLTAMGVISLLLAAALLLWLASAEEQRRDRSRHRQLNECLMLLMLHLLGARFAYFMATALSSAISAEPYNAYSSYTYAVPLASLALITVLLYGRNVALVLSLVFSLLVGQVAGGDGAVWNTMVYAIVSSLTAVFALDHQQFKQRSAMTRAGVVIGMVNVLAVLGLTALGGELDGGLPQLGFDLLCALAGGLLASAVASFAVPILENLLSITTSIKLIELANTNLPMLRRLALEAPGTFQHSLAVANLAKAGAEAIDGDALLIHTTALYHDIGKIFRPQYFIENQMPGQNPHDKIQPSMSALILINHVKEGLELAHQANLPGPIIEAIEQHHGTRLIKFFYNRAQERCDPETEAIREEEFRYPGPKPQSKEMGVMMLADAVEAASRTLVDPSRQKLRGVVRAVFDDCLKDQQLDHTDLTLGDLRKVDEAFMRVLTNIHHRRIDYPGFDFNAEKGKKGMREDSRVSGERPKRFTERDDSAILNPDSQVLPLREGRRQAG